MHLHVDDRNQNQRSYPESEDRVERRHRRAVVFNLIDTDRLQIYRGRNKGSQLLRITLYDFKQLLILVILL